MRRQFTAATAAAVLALAGLAGCSSNNDRRCEHDTTDTPVAASYCEDGTPGYEWDTGNDTHRRHTRGPSKTSRPLTKTSSRPKTRPTSGAGAGQPNPPASGSNLRQSSGSTSTRPKK